MALMPSATATMTAAGPAPPRGDLMRQLHIALVDFYRHHLAEPRTQDAHPSRLDGVLIQTLAAERGVMVCDDLNLVSKLESASLLAVDRQHVSRQRIAQQVVEGAIRRELTHEVEKAKEVPKTLELVSRVIGYVRE